MTLTDIHTHSAFSADGKSSLTGMVSAAREKGVRYYGISDHFDYDYAVHGILAQGKTVPLIDAPAYFSCARALQAQTESETFRLIVGGEFGYDGDKRCCDLYAEVAEKFRPDFIVNSVHTCDGEDCYFTAYFADKRKEYAYSRYLERVRESLEAPYPYDIVAHVGYVSRNATYPDSKLRYEEFPELVDDILRAVIAKNKILEVNSSARGAGSAFLPDTDILTRYFDLGGRAVSYASDAHLTARICEGRETVAAALKKIGFTHVTVPDCGKWIEVLL